MSTEEKLRNLIIEKYGSMRAFCKEIQMSPSTLTTIFQRGIHSASIQNVIKICQALGISTDELAENRVIPVDAKERQALRLLGYARELEMVVSLSREYKNSYEPYCIDGKEMTPEETELFIDGIELLMNLIRKQRIREYISPENKRDYDERETEF